jgi:hypothetical protein
MSDELDDLWPDLNSATIITPASILKTQAAALSQKTNGLLQGEVETSFRGKSIIHEFDLVVPALENYRYSLLRIHHEPTLYPVYVDESPIPVVAGENTGRHNWYSTTAYVLQDEAAFRAWLRQALAAPDTKRILENLLAQATV